MQWGGVLVVPSLWCPEKPACRLNGACEHHAASRGRAYTARAELSGAELSGAELFDVHWRATAGIEVRMGWS